MTRVMGWLVPGFLAIALSPCVLAQGLPQPNSRFGPVLEAAAEFGGDNVVKVFYTNGDTQDLRAGQGVTVSAGLHYQLQAAPVDIAATVGYKFVTTSDYHTDLGIHRVVLKLTGTYELPRHFWIDAGPVWHTAVKVTGDGYLPDINFNDAFGGTIGFGWRWFGVTYTAIRYTSPVTNTVNADNVGVTATWKF